MVSDKSQVRALGPIDQLTTQPLKGRKLHGGIRFGEMERDSMLAHGTSYLLQDRLLNCSDHHIVRWHVSHGHSFVFVFDKCALFCVLLKSLGATRVHIV